MNTTALPVIFVKLFKVLFINLASWALPKRLEASKGLDYFWATILAQKTGFEFELITLQDDSWEPLSLITTDIKATVDEFIPSIMRVIIFIFTHAGQIFEKDQAVNAKINSSIYHF